MKWVNKLVFMVCILLCLLSFVSCVSNSKKSSETADINQLQEINMVIERHPFAADYTRIFGKLDKLPEKSNAGYDIRSTDLSESDLSNEYDKLLQATFDS